MADKPVDPAKGNALLQKLMRTRPLPVVHEPAPLAPSAIPSGLKHDPIAQQLSKMGLRVTRAAWLSLDRGSSDETYLDEETKAMLDRMFPQEEQVAPDPLATLIKDTGDLLAQNDGQREVIDAILRSVFSAMQRVAPEHQVELQELVRAFVADPGDKDVKWGN